jgi:hypothetical protein
MNWLKKLFDEKKEQSKHKLLIIEDNASLLNVALGISEERSEELLNKCNELYKNNDCLSIALQKLVDFCNHTNEIVFSTLIMQKIIERTEAKNNFINDIKKLFDNE